MTSAQVRRLDPSECEALIRALGDTPETVIAVHQLRHGLCQAYSEAGSDHHDAVVLRPSHPSDELVGFGPRRRVAGAGAPGPPRLVLRARGGRDRTSARSDPGGRSGAADPLPDGYLSHDGTARRGQLAPVGPVLDGRGLDLLDRGPARHPGGLPGVRDLERLLQDGAVAGAVIDGELVAVASTWAVSERYRRPGGRNCGPWRGQGMATACAGLVAAGIQRSGRVPVWSTGEDNVASLRVARKLGFGEVGRRTYVIRRGRGSSMREGRFPGRVCVRVE